jgi:hypothetical protein
VSELPELPQGDPLPAESGRLLPARVPEARVLEPAPPRPLAAPALAAVGGFLVGFTTFLLTRVLRRRRRSVALPGGRRRRGVEVAASRSFLVDVHLLKR